MTPTDLIRFILRNAQVNGVGQTPTAEDNNDMLTHLNLLLGQWSAARTLVYHLAKTTISVTGAATYTVGSGGDFNITRPDLIDSAVYRYTGTTPNTEYVLRMVTSQQDWNRIILKNVGNWPDRFFYDKGNPLGTFYIYPIPTTGQIFINTKEELAQFTDLTTDIALPAPYLNALLWNGASVARVAYGLEPDENVEKRAKGALDVIRASNFAPELLRMPIGIPGQRFRYNIYSDTGG